MPVKLRLTTECLCMCLCMCLWVLMVTLCALVFMFFQLSTAGVCAPKINYHIHLSTSAQPPGTWCLGSTAMRKTGWRSGAFLYTAARASSSHPDLDRRASTDATSLCESPSPPNVCMHHRTVDEHDKLAASQRPFASRATVRGTYALCHASSA
jgi:hypothetical protein